jgi:uncharacterized protein
MSGLKARIRALGVAAVVVIAAGLAAVVIPLAAFVFMSVLGVQPSPTLIIALSIVLTQGVAFGGVALLYLRLRRGRVRVPLRWPTARDLQWMVGGSALALGALVVGGIVISLLGIEVGAHQVQDLGMADPEIFALLIPLSFLLIGPGEELLFRGVIQGRLRQAFGPVSAVTIAAVIFAAVHITALTGPTHARIAGVALLLLPSLVFGLSYERTRNIAVPAVIHGTYNATLLAVSTYAAGLEGVAGA